MADEALPVGDLGPGVLFEPARLGRELNVEGSGGKQGQSEQYEAAPSAGARQPCPRDSGLEFRADKAVRAPLAFTDERFMRR